MITGAARGVTGSGAELVGTVNPRGLAASYFFEWSPDQSYSQSSARASAGSGTAPVEAVLPVAELTCDTIYHFRLVGEGPYGRTYGDDSAFQTSNCVQQLVLFSDDAETGTPSDHGWTAGDYVTTNPHSGARSFHPTNSYASLPQVPDTYPIEFRFWFYDTGSAASVGMRVGLADLVGDVSLAVHWGDSGVYNLYDQGIMRGSPVQRSVGWHLGVLRFASGSIAELSVDGTPIYAGSVTYQVDISALRPFSWTNMPGAALDDMLLTGGVAP